MPCAWTGASSYPPVGPRAAVARLQLVEYHGKVLALARRVALDVEKLRRMRHGVEQNAELRRQVQGQDRLLSRRELDRVDHDFLEQPLVCVVLGKVDA